jgi:hypothetical protein
VVDEHDRAPVRERSHAARQRETGPDVLDHAHVVSERVVDRPFGVGRVRKAADRVGVHVVDVGRGQERVQERLDRGPRRVGLDHAPREVRQHLLVAQRHALAQRQELVQPEAREVAAARRREIGAAALDPDRTALAPEVVALEQLARGVATAVEDERAIRSDQPRARHEPLELRAAGNRLHDRHASA